MTDVTEWTRGAIEALGPTTDVPTTAQILDLGAWTVYDMIKRQTWTNTRVLRYGRRIKIPTSDLVSLLYPSTQGGSEPAAAGGRLAAVHA
ncbi:hypothetical protein [Parafrankia sp. EUN1f]|uniref:hypothetical protein n=1 Tax=Parafrankia sp. EUN1f TaxID=102897 RepID=UPI0001C4755F|nr:hypothetical protein [Parafrankia sp. EUN1f]EFC79297.1 hypothetical protein FrEUN1fDRAFT_7572 [Parafrankia sp. EUN1f]